MRSSTLVGASLKTRFVLGAAGDLRPYSREGGQCEKVKWRGIVRSRAWLPLTEGDERQRG